MAIDEFEEENVDKNIFSICNQQAKGLAKLPEYTFVMQEPWTNTHFDRLDDEIAQAARAVVSQKFPRQNILNLQVKKWRYAQPTRIWNEFFESPAPSLYLAGDAFGGASLNGALKSSNSLADHLKNVRHLRTNYGAAKKMGEKLGSGQVLQRSVPQRETSGLL